MSHTPLATVYLAMPAMTGAQQQALADAHRGLQQPWQPVTWAAGGLKPEGVSIGAGAGETWQLCMLWGGVKPKSGGTGLTGFVGGQPLMPPLFLQHLHSRPQPARLTSAGGCWMSWELLLCMAGNCCLIVGPLFCECCMCTLRRTCRCCVSYSFVAPAGDQAWKGAASGQIAHRQHLECTARSPRRISPLSVRNLTHSRAYSSVSAFVPHGPRY